MKATGYSAFGCTAMIVCAVIAALPCAGASCWTSGWTEVTPQNGVWDEYYRRTDDPANCSFRFRVSRYADSRAKPL